MLRKWIITAACSGVLGVLVWASDFITLQGERTIYTAGCQDGVWKGDLCTGKLVAAERYRFRALKAHNEVLFWTVGSPGPSGKFTRCVVTNGRYWSCEASGEASAAVTREMRHGMPVSHPGENTRPFHQISKFRWMLLRYGISVGNTVSSS
jgi:hypothetical protein